MHSAFPMDISYVDFLFSFSLILISVSLDNDGNMVDYDWAAPNGFVVVVNYLLCISIVLFIRQSYNFHPTILF